jgi:hypothetical protein
VVGVVGVGAGLAIDRQLGQQHGRASIRVGAQCPSVPPPGVSSGLHGSCCDIHICEICMITISRAPIARNTCVPAQRAPDLRQWPQAST